MNFLRDAYAEDLRHYNGDDMHYIIEILSKKYQSNAYNDSTESVNRTRRHIGVLQPMFTVSLTEPAEREQMRVMQSLFGADTRWQQGSSALPVHMQTSPDVLHSSMQDSGNKPRLRHAHNDASSLAHARKGDMQKGVKHTHYTHEPIRSKRATAEDSHSKVKQGDDEVQLKAQQGTDSAVTEWPVTTYDSLGEENGTESIINGTDAESNPYPKKEKSLAEKLLKIAHILHYISIGILGLFVVQVRKSLLYLTRI